MGKPDAVERFKAWQCIGCGRIESPQPCIGVCRDRNEVASSQRSPQ